AGTVTALGAVADPSRGSTHRDHAGPGVGWAGVAATATHLSGIAVTSRGPALRAAVELGVRWTRSGGAVARLHRVAHAGRPATHCARGDRTASASEGSAYVAGLTVGGAASAAVIAAHAVDAVAAGASVPGATGAAVRL